MSWTTNIPWINNQPNDLPLCQVFVVYEAWPLIGKLIVFHLFLSMLKKKRIFFPWHFNIEDHWSSRLIVFKIFFTQQLKHAANPTSKTSWWTWRPSPAKWPRSSVRLEWPDLEFLSPNSLQIIPNLVIKKITKSGHSVSGGHVVHRGLHRVVSRHGEWNRTTHQSK